MAFDTVSPRDCELLLGIPLTAEDLAADLRCPAKEYAAIFRNHFPGAQVGFVLREYERTVADPVLAIADEVAAWGVRVELRATIDSLRPAFSRSRVVAILAHSPEPGSRPADGLVDHVRESASRCIELRDGPATIGAVAEQIPDSWDGIVDFIACESSVHAHALKRRHPMATFIVNRRHASPVLRLRRFCASIALLRREPQPYGEAVVAVLKMAAG
jgi:hypothetical protein